MSLAQIRRAAWRILITPISGGPKLHPALVGGVFDALFLFLGLSALDCYVFLKVSLAACLTHWVGAAIVLLRRPDNLTPGDRFFLQAGGMLLIPLSAVFAGIWLDLAWSQRWWWLTGLG